MKITAILLFFISSTCIIYSQSLSREQIAEITEAIPKLIVDNYVFPKRGEEISRKFQKNLTPNKYVKFTNPNELVQALTHDIRDLGNDGHLYVSIKKKTTDTEEELDWEEIEKRDEIYKNFGFTNIQVLPNNIGYIKIVEFMHPKRSMATAVAAMKIVEQTKGLIIDLRNNGGGYPGIMEYVLNHYFEGPPEHLHTTHFADGSSTDKSYTSDLVYGKLRVGTPLYILINSRTGSAAEYFAYTLQAFNKAVIVGEKSAGAAHMNDFFDLPYDFKISISVAAPISAKTNNNWELIGVVPNFETTSEKALEKTLDLMKEEMNEKSNRSE